MHWIKRIGYYLIGLSLGSVVVFFIWKGKDVSFDYGPDARTLKSIRVKKMIYSNDALNTLSKNSLDSTAIQSILLNGDVNFSKSDQRKKPCGEYYISGKYNESNIDFWVIRCDSISTIDKVWLK
ncbi:DUF4258 domain-containing protein [Flavobacteriaceae bacterium S356]|uniref:DUF4258 domain-containing protein n=1 Tax=Asprobacillus argus TaxID=3076534 RepID=A0ABU3LEP4_9FLAO|nr:DUF4258 domain-containing protein [Flavobacteriaceae bacterium S356]